MEDEDVTFRPMSREDLLNKYNDHDFWYLYDETRKQIIAAPNMNGMEDLGYAFVERADAETLRYLLSKTPAYQDDRKQAKVMSDKWPVIDASAAATLGEAKWIALEADQAKILLDYIHKDVPLTEAQEQELKDLADYDYS